MYRYQFRGFYPASRLPQPKNTGSQNLWRPGHSWKMFLGMVFRVQATPGNQRQGRDPEFHVLPGERGWQGTVKTRELPERYQGKTLCGQRVVYRSSPVRKPVLEWNTIADKREEQHEKLVDECRGQNPVTKTGVDRDREWRIEEYCANWTLQTQIIQ